VGPGGLAEGSRPGPPAAATPPLRPRASRPFAGAEVAPEDPGVPGQSGLGAGLLLPGSPAAAAMATARAGLRSPWVATRPSEAPVLRFDGRLECHCETFATGPQRRPSCPISKLGKPSERTGEAAGGSGKVLDSASKEGHQELPGRLLRTSSGHPLSL